MAKHHRRLAAIMFTDLVGYTALMGKNREQGLALVHQSVRIQKPLVEKFNGYWLKELGDGVLTQFDSAIDAVHCAIEIQKAARAELDGKLRIGIHLGDITFENKDVYGDGVNVASRLESIADPGGIYISESVEKAIRGESDIQTVFLGESELKNVDYKVRIYAIQGIGLPKSSIKADEGASGVLSEFISRGILRVSAIYIGVSLLLVFLQDLIRPVLALPDWSETVLVLALAFMFPAALYLAWHYEMSPHGFVRTGTLEAKENPYNISQRKPFTSSFMIAGLLIITLIVYIAPKLISENDSGQVLPANAFPNNKSIAVLPFKNLSGSDENQYFSDGVMEAILNNLSLIRDLKVISRTSVERYRDQNLSIREIARDLEVANVLEGSVQRVGDEVRITVQLISAENDEHIWADNYDRELTDIFEIQSEIAQTIAENLEVIMTAEEQELIRNAPTSNLKAYEMYLKAAYMETNSENDILDALSIIDEVIQLDPDFCLAYAEKGFLCARLSYHGYPESIWYDSAVSLFNLAIVKDDHEWQPYFGKAMINSAVHNDEEAIRYLRKTIDLNPNFSRAYHDLGEYAMDRGNYDEAIDHFLKAATLIGKESDRTDQELNYGYFLQRLDYEQSCSLFHDFYKKEPENFQVIQELINCARYYKDFDMALKYSKEAIRLRPELVNVKNILAYSYFCLNRYEEAERYYREMMEETDQFESHYMIYPFAHRLGYAMYMNGKEKEGLSIMETYRDTLISSINRKEIKAMAIGEYYDLATIYSCLGQKKEALKWMRKAKDTEGAFFRLDYLNSDPMLENLRDEPEFQQMMTEKIEEDEHIRQTFYDKLAMYHTNNELKWLSRK